MIRPIYTLLAAVLLAAVALAAPQKQAPTPARPKVPAALQAQINNAIDLGIESLLARQSLDGSWTQQIEGYGTGMTGLALYTLMKSGLAPAHPVIERGFRFLSKEVPNKTYSRACVTLAVATRGRRKKDAKWLDDLVESLTRSQGKLGWGYPSGAPDLSNTQFAALALRAAEASGAKVSPRTWTKLADAAVLYLEEEVGGTSSGYAPRGFMYRSNNPNDVHATGSMTGAGIAVLSIALDHMRAKKGEHVRAFEQGKAWMNEHFTVKHNPSPTRESGSVGNLYYYLYGLERVGSLIEVEEYGGHPWYELGAKRLIGLQSKDGAWGGQSDTCFGLLFLARATGSLGPSSGGKGGSLTSRWTFGDDNPRNDVSLRASGRKVTTLWISSFGTRAKLSHGSGEDGDGPLPVERVEYWIEPDGKGDPTLAATFTVEDLVADAKKTLQGRYAVRCDLGGPRTCKVYAWVYLVGVETPIESVSLSVRVGVRERESWTDYAIDRERNLLAGARIDVIVSSAAAGGRAKGKNVVDGYVGLGWKPAKDDADPWIQLELSKGVRANTILLSHGELTGALFGRFEVIINDRAKARIESEMVPDVREKTVLMLPKAMKIKTFRIRFLGGTKGGSGGAPASLGEIEFQMRR